jgi:hypothetical protein
MFSNFKFGRGHTVTSAIRAWIDPRCAQCGAWQAAPVELAASRGAAGEADGHAYGKPRSLRSGQVTQVINLTCPPGSAAQGTCQWALGHVIDLK